MRVSATMWAIRILTLAIVIAGLAALSPLAPLWGDGVEYAATLIAWINHASPDLRPPDIAAIPSAFNQVGFNGLHPNMIIASASGATYSLHFWFYSLACAPLAFLLRASGADPLIAFPVTNAILLGLLVWLAIFWPGAPARRDRAMIALATLTPVIWYLPFAHPEAFTWACVLASLIAVNRRRYGTAAALAACGAMQNPPVALLAGYCVVLAMMACGWRGALLPGAAAALSLTPATCSLLAFGHPNPIVQRGFIDFHLMTPARAWSLFSDLDQGLVVYVPGLLVLAIVALLRRATLRLLGMAIVLGLMIAIVTMNVIWNTSLAGLIRYGVWMIPILAWLATESMPTTRGFYASVALALVVNVALLVTPPNQSSHSRLATYALQNHPSWYDPAPEILADRLLGIDEAWDTRFPLAYRRPNGVITKVLVDRPRLPQIDRMFIVDPAYLARVTADAPRDSGAFYLDPPIGSVRSRCSPKGAHPRAFQRDIRVDLVGLPDSSAARRVDVIVNVANDGTLPLCNLGSGATNAFNLTFRILRGDEPLGSDAGERTRGPQLLLPGESVPQQVTVVLPAQSGRYTAEVLPVLEGRTFGTRGARFVVDVRAEHGTYTAAMFPQPLPAAL